MLDERHLNVAQARFEEALITVNVALVGPQAINSSSVQKVVCRLVATARSSVSCIEADIAWYACELVHKMVNHDDGVSLELERRSGKSR
jgi:Ca2+/H+ antiporter